MTPRAPRPVFFALPPGFLLLDLAGVVEAFRYANEYCGAEGPRFELHFVSALPGPEVQSSVGLCITGTSPLPETLSEDAIVVVVGARSSAALDRSPGRRDLVSWLRTNVRASHWVLCICSGALLAARAGLLDHRDCTTHHELCAQLARECPSARVAENRIFVRDGNIFTSAGVTAGIDLALFVLEELMGPTVALEIARTLVVYLRREGSDPQLSAWLLHRNHLHPLVHRVQDAVMGEPGKNWPLPTLAKVAHVSPRHLTRLFQEHAGVSPAAYVANLRNARATELLRSTHLPIERVAEEAGFGSARQFRRRFRAEIGISPSRAR